MLIKSIPFSGAHTTHPFSLSFTPLFFTSQRTKAYFRSFLGSPSTLLDLTRLYDV